MEIEGPVPGLPGAFVRRVAELPAELAAGKPAGPYAQAVPGELLLAVPEVGRFRVRDGTTIEVALEPGADPGVVMLHLQGSARGALIHQRGDLPLHAATLVPPGRERAAAICGARGAGKSTLAAELCRRGWTLVADDTTRISRDAAGPLAWPSRDSIKLWHDVCRAADLDVSAMERVTAKLDKYYLRVRARSEPAVLAQVFELTFDAAAEFELQGAPEKMALLTRHTYRPAQILPLGQAADHVRIVADVARACRMFRLAGARRRSAGALASAVEKVVL